MPPKPKKAEPKKADPGKKTELKKKEKIVEVTMRFLML